MPKSHDANCSNPTIESTFESDMSTYPDASDTQHASIQRVTDDRLPKTLSSLKKTFHKLDIAHSGHISPHSVAKSLSKMGLKAVKKTNSYRALQSRYQNDPTQLISFPEFLEIFHEAHLRKTFDTLDMDKSNTVSVQEFRIALKKHLGWRISGDKASQLVSLLDSNHDGELLYDDFIAAFSDLPLPDLRSIMQRWVNMTNMDAGSELFPGLPPDLGSNVNVWRYFLAGGVAGAATRAILAPAERIIISMQTSDTTSTVRQVVRNVVREEGWRGLYNGTAMSMVKVFPFSGIVCIAYSYLLKFMDRCDYETISGMGLQKKRLIAGATAGCLATTATFPIDLLRTRIASNASSSLSYREIVNSVVKEHGVLGMYKGLTSTLLAVMCFVCIQQTAYDSLFLELVHRSEWANHNRFFTAVGCGIASGSAAQLAIHPLDLIRRRLQLSGEAENLFNYRGLRDGAQQIWQSSRFMGYYRGALLSVAKVSPAVSITFVVRDFCLGRLKSPLRSGSQQRSKETEPSAKS